MSIILVEDDEIQAKSIARKMRQAFRGHTVTVLTTEADFRAQFEALASNPPTIFVIDVMLRWTTPKPQMPERPEDVRREGPNRAGFRCKAMLTADVRTKQIPVVLYTVLGKNDLRGELDETRDLYVQKGPEPNDLVAQLRAFLTTEDQGGVGSFAFSRNRRRA